MEKKDIEVLGETEEEGDEYEYDVEEEHNGRIVSLEEVKEVGGIVLTSEPDDGYPQKIATDVGIFVLECFETFDDGTVEAHYL